MNKIILIVTCICLPFLWSIAHADESKKFNYCGHLSFYIPTYFDKQSLIKQAKLDTCKNGFTLKSKIGNKSTDVGFTGEYIGVRDVKNEEYLAQFKANFPQRLYYTVSYNTPNGIATILTFYWLDGKGLLRKIEKILFFSKNNSMSATAAYTANPNDPNDILFMNALEQLFLSAEIDW